MANNQSKIEKLITELYPNGVEFKEVGEICQISRGKVISKDYLVTNAGEYPVYSSPSSVKPRASARGVSLFQVIKEGKYEKNCSIYSR